MQRNLSGFEHSVCAMEMAATQHLYKEISSANVTVRGIS